MTLKKAIPLLIASITVLLAVFGLYWREASERTYQLTKELPLTKKGTPKSIVSLSPNLTEIVFALGLGDSVVGVSNNCDWPAEAKSKPKMGTFWQPSAEAIIAARPDLVICETFAQQKETAETLKSRSYNGDICLTAEYSQHDRVDELIAKDVRYAATACR